MSETDPWMIPPDEIQAEVQLRATEVPPVAWVGGGGLVVCGAVVLAAGFQALFLMEGWRMLPPIGQVLAGAALFAFGGATTRGEDWAAIAGAATSAALTIALTGWVLWSTLLEGFWSPLAWLAPPAALVAMFAALVAIPGCRRVSAARRMLMG